MYRLIVVQLCNVQQKRRPVRATLVKGGFSFCRSCSPFPNANQAPPQTNTPHKTQGCRSRKQAPASASANRDGRA
jgi:hypothetical protein